MNEKVEATAIILAGGQSTRIGHNKGLLKLGGLTLAERAVSRLAPFFSDIVYATNDPESAPGGVVAVRDEVPHLGPLGGILAGLKAARYDYSFAVAFDMPFARPDIGLRLLALSPGFDVVVPLVNGKYEPLHALYSRRCVEEIEARLAAGDRRIISLYDVVKVRAVAESELPPLGLTFFNINTWADYAKAKMEVARTESGDPVDGQQ